MSDLTKFLEYNYSIALFQIPYMTLAFVLCIVLKNGSMVDFAWPSGFFVMAIQIFLKGDGWYNRKLLITIPYIFCGLRFMYGWAFKRKHHIHEDTRWNLWREKWRNGGGLLGIKSEEFNFFFFYHAQSISNVFFFSVPLIIATQNEEKGFHILEILGIMTWFVSFILENVSDFQLQKFKRKNRDEVMCTGLWKYSRHPNYFFEWMLWLSYSLIAYASVKTTTEMLFLISAPISAYYFLVYFTGVPMCEEASLRKRGEKYRKYQESTNMFFPNFLKN